MLFHSFQFVFEFLPATLAVYYLARLADSRLAGSRLAWMWLVYASLFFYAAWQVDLVLLLLASMICNFALSHAIAKTGKSPLGAALLGLGVTANLAAIGFFKYAGFAAENLGLLVGHAIDLPKIVLPLAISFYTFQQIAYLVDVRNDPKAAVGPLEYLFFTTFFPHLIAGPICYQQEIVPQMEQKRSQSELLTDIQVGLTAFVIGLFKKLVVSKAFQEMADAAFGAAATVSPEHAWTGVLAFSFQIYFDFSAYSDMACGLALMFGVRLPLNFYSPYKAASIIEFWRCWHITLSRFLRDYLYIPLGGNRVGTARMAANLLIVMFLAGLWHGANWTFVAWGAAHGAMLAINHAFRHVRGAAAHSGSTAGAWAGRVLTFVSVTAAWVLFRSQDFAQARAMFRSMAAITSHGLAQIDVRTTLTLAVGFFICWALPNTMQLLAAFGPTCTEPPPALSFDRRRTAYRLSLSRRWAAGLGMLAFVTLLLSFDRPPSTFIYFQF